MNKCQIKLKVGSLSVLQLFSAITRRKPEPYSYSVVCYMLGTIVFLFVSQCIILHGIDLYGTDSCEKPVAVFMF